MDMDTAFGIPMEVRPEVQSLEVIIVGLVVWTLSPD
jgi:hypothetical protein